MIKMIRPIVNTAKIIEDFDAVIVGFSGVLSDGAVIRKEAVDALINMKKNGKRIVLCSNTVLRVSQLCDLFVENKVPLKLFDAIITAGEILHYKLKNRSGDLEHIGQKYYRLGSGKNTVVFANLDYQAVNSLPEADFMFMDSVAAEDDTIDRYMPQLEQAAGMGIPFVIAGNDTSSFKDGKICLAPGALAEQYAVLGGRIIIWQRILKVPIWPGSAVCWLPKACMSTFWERDISRTWPRPASWRQIWTGIPIILFPICAGKD